MLLISTRDFLLKFRNIFCSLLGMPPKKIQKINGQCDLRYFLGQIIPDSDQSTEKDTNNNVVNIDKDSSVKKSKGRLFLKKWYNDFSWLRYDEDHNYMYCSVCTKSHKQNGMHQVNKCQNFQYSTLTRHAQHPEHLLLIQSPQQRANLEECRIRNESRMDKAMKVLLRVVHWIIFENIPISKFRSLLSLLKDLEVPDMKILEQCPFNYDSEYTASEMLDSLAAVADSDIDSKLKKSPFITLLADESTDITNTKRLVIYAQILEDNVQPTTVYVNNVECKDASGKGIAQSMLNELSSREVNMEKVMSVGSDGASVMTGKKNGVAAILRRQNPHMTNVHCVAHRLALCTSQAAAGISHLQKHQQILTDMFYYFKGSSKRETRLKEIQDVLDGPILAIKEIHSVRWLSYFQALTTVFRSLDSLFTYFAEVSAAGIDKDPKCNGLRKKIATDTFISTTYMLMDAMAPVTILSQFLQTENVDVALVKVKLDLCVQDLEKVKAMESPYCQQLKQDLQGNRFRDQHHVTNTNFDLSKLTECFVDALIANILSRFPDTDLLTSFSVLGMRPISMLSAKDLDEYGVEEIETMCKFYGEKQTVHWKDEFNEEQVKTSNSLVVTDEVKNEWRVLKQVVKAERYPRDNMGSLWKLINTYHGSQFPSLIKLAQLALTSAVHTAGCERGFSMQNSLLTKVRNRLTVEKQNKIMRVKMCKLTTNDIVDRELIVNKAAKHRRIYSITEN